MDINRPLGILTKTDRQYLLGEKEYQSQSAELNKRRDIRRRIKNGIYDFALINRNLPERDRDKLFSEIAAGPEPDQEEFLNAAETLISWLYVGLKKGGFNAKAIFERAVETGESDIGITGSAKIVQSEATLNIRTREIEGVQQTIQKLEQGKPIMGHQLFPLARNNVSVDFSGVDKAIIWSDSGQIASDRELYKVIIRNHLNADIDIEVIPVDD